MRYVDVISFIMYAYNYVDYDVIYCYVYINLIHASYELL